MSIARSAEPLTCCCPRCWPASPSLASTSTTIKSDAQGWNQLGKLLEARDYSAAQTLVSEQLRDEPLHPAGLLMRLTVHQYQSRGQQQPPQTLAADLKRCIEKDPEAAPCHLGLAELYGMEASSGGMLKGMRLADDIRDHFKRAVELDPHNLRARSGLLSFYQAAPAIVGGGSERATALIAETREVAPDAAKLLDVGRLLRDKQHAAASTTLLALPTTTDFDTRSLQQRGLISLGFALIGEQQWDQASRVLQHASEHFPQSPFAAMGLGRIHLEQGDAKAAVPLLERALQLDPQCGANYRLGLAYQELDRKTDAISQFQSFLDLPSASRSKDLLKDARARIKQLRSGGNTHGMRPQGACNTASTTSSKALLNMNPTRGSGTYRTVRCRDQSHTCALARKLKRRLLNKRHRRFVEVT